MIKDLIAFAKIGILLILTVSAGCAGSSLACPGKYSYDRYSGIHEKLQLLNKQIQKGTCQYDAYVQRGIIFRSIGAYRTAIQDFTAAISLAPETAAAFRERALVCSILGYSTVAVDDFTSAIELDSSFDWTYFGRGCWFLFSEKYNMASADFLSYLRLAGTNKSGCDLMLYLSLAMQQDANPLMSLRQVELVTDEKCNDDLEKVHSLFAGKIDPDAFLMNATSTGNLDACTAYYILGQYYKSTEQTKCAEDAFLRVLLWGSETDYVTAGAREELKRMTSKALGSGE